MFCAHCGQEVQTLGAECPACGKPASGAPSQAATGGSGLPTVVIVIGAGFVAVAIIGIIAAIAIPNLLNAIDRGRQKRTMADLRTIGTAIEAHGVDYYFYPNAETFAELPDSLEPVYVKRLPREDGWENSFAYVCWQENPESKGCDHYAIASPARDGVFELADLRGYWGTESQTDDSDCDIVYANGMFVQFPGGL